MENRRPIVSMLAALFHSLYRKFFMGRNRSFHAERFLLTRSYYLSGYSIVPSTSQQGIKPLKVPVPIAFSNLPDPPVMV